MSDIEVGEVFTLSDENNEEQEVEVLGAMDVEGAEYIAVAFVEDIQTETEEDIDIFFLKVEEDNEFSYIENDEEFDTMIFQCNIVPKLNFKYITYLNFKRGFLMHDIYFHSF